MKEDQYAFPGSARLISHNPETGQSVTAPITQGGMSLRAYFAGKAMQSIVQATISADLHASAQTPPDDVIVKWAVSVADAMIAELNKTQQ